MVERLGDVQRRSLITELGSTIAGLEDGLGVTEIEAQLDALLGNSLSKVLFPMKTTGLLMPGDQRAN